MRAPESPRAAPGSPTAGPERPAAGAAAAGAARLAVAAGFLTRLPLGRRTAAGPDVLLRAAPLFPLVGAALGAAVAGVAVVAALGLPPLAAGALAVAFELTITGALHADGLADSADGLAAGRDRERALAIMRDHQLGTFGASALGLELLLKAVALGALADDPSGGGTVVAVAMAVAAYALSRAVALPLAAALPYARPEGGTGRLLDGAAARPAAAGVLLAIAIAFAVLVVGAASGAPAAALDVATPAADAAIPALDALAPAAAAAIAALALTATVALVALAVGLLARRRLGGVTGDVLGAAIELSATVALLTAVALAS